MRCRSFRHYGERLARHLPSLAFGDNAEHGMSDEAAKALAPLAETTPAGTPCVCASVFGENVCRRCAQVDSTQVQA